MLSVESPHRILVENAFATIEPLSDELMPACFVFKLEDVEVKRGIVLGLLINKHFQVLFGHEKLAFQVEHYILFFVFQFFAF